MRKKTISLFTNFFESEKSGGLILVFVTLISLGIANSVYQVSYLAIWNQHIGSHSVVEWINDGLMAVFFLLIGLELEREIYIGELSSIKKATLPVFAAVGGMFLPAALYLFLNFGTSTQSGTGIPMATDIAFAIGILSLLGKKVPLSLKIFLTALAVIDDLGAIFVIALFYTKSISWLNLGIAMGIWTLLLAFNRLKIKNLIPYLIGGVLMWYFMMNSGIHATITGVLLAFAIPFGNGEPKSSSFLLQDFLHKPVAFLILPLFAMANTCIKIDTNWQTGLGSWSSIGIILGLLIGKPLGIWLFSFIGTSFGLCALPKGIGWKHILGIGILGGIGFTMSIFITLLAFDSSAIIINSKIAILIASLIAGLIGYIVLKFALKSSK